MSRITPYLGIVAAIAVVIFIAALFSTPAAPAPQAPATATTTIVVVENSSAPASEPRAATSTSATLIPTVPDTKPPAREPVVPKVAVAIPAPAEPAPAPVVPPAPTNAELDAAAAALRAALVNILCYSPAGSGLRSISGSGVIIDPKGIILTNAHIANRFLLADRGVSCTIRAGSPAADRYEAALIYISPLWLRVNEAILTEANPSGNGEYDFALLAITGSATSLMLPSSFPSIPLARDPLMKGAPVVIASYGAQFLAPDQVRFSLSPIVVFGSVKDVYTFKSNTIDVLALGGSAAAQEGSSGGGVANAAGELAGTITTSTVEGSTDTRSLDALSASYIRVEYASETGSALDLLLTKPLSTAIAEFAPQIPALAAIITAQLP